METLLEEQSEKQKPMKSLWNKLNRLFPIKPAPEEELTVREEAAEVLLNEEPEAPAEEMLQPVAVDEPSAEPEEAEKPDREEAIEPQEPVAEKLSENQEEPVPEEPAEEQEELPVKLVEVTLPEEDPEDDVPLPSDALPQEKLSASEFPEDEDITPEELGLSDPGEVDEASLTELDDEPDLDALDEEADLPEGEESPLEAENKTKAPEEAQPVGEELSAPTEEEAPADTREPEAAEEEIQQTEAENQPEQESEADEKAETSEAEKLSGEPEEKYTPAAWWIDNCYRCFAVFISAVLLTMTLAIHSDLLLCVSVYRAGEEAPALTRVSIEHDLDQLLADAGFVWQEGDGYRWSGYGEDHRASLVYCPMFTVSIQSKLDGENSFTTNSVVEKTLRELLEERGYEFGELDYMEPDFSTVPMEDCTLTIHRVEVRDYEDTRIIPYETIYKETSLFYRNQSRQLKTVDGVDGEARIAVHERYLDGEMVEQNEEVLETITEPVNEIIKVYGAGAPVSDMEGPPIVDGKPEGWRLVLTGRATGYSAGRTYRRVKGASGMWLTYGYVAVNPHQIPYGTKLYIVSQDGNFVYGYCIAADTGIALMEGIISVDLFYDTYTESAINAVWNVNIYAEPQD